MDNQQESLLWWLGGIIDGEGCITINHHRLHRNTQKETLLFSPIIVIVNTNKVLIETCQEILRTSGIPHFVSYTDSSKKNPHWKPKWSITISGLKRVSKALAILSPYIIAKKEEKTLVKRFCDLRLTKPLEKTSYGGMAAPLYGDDEFEIIEQVAKIHNRNPQRLHDEIREYKERIRPQVIRNRQGRFTNKDIV